MEIENIAISLDEEIESIVKFITHFDSEYNASIGRQISIQDTLSLVFSSLTQELHANSQLRINMSKYIEGLFSYLDRNLKIVLINYFIRLGDVIHAQLIKFGCYNRRGILRYRYEYTTMGFALLVKNKPAADRMTVDMTSGQVFIN